MFLRKRQTSDFGAEIEAHVELETERLQEQGLSYADARAAALRAFGNVAQAQERFYESHRWLWWDHLWQDIRFALRTLRKSPAFTLVAVLTVALGVGANTAIFSIVNGVLLRSLPFPDPDRLVRIYFSTPGTGMRGILYSVPELEDLRTRPGVFEYVTGIERGSIDMTGVSRPERLEQLTSSANFFAMLGAHAQIGRLFGPEDYTRGLAPSVVISDSLWRREFGGDPNVLGRVIRLDTEPYTIVGVLPSDFHNPGRAAAHDIDVFLASGYMSPSDPPPTRSGRAFPGVLGRLKPGITLEQAQARLTAMAAEIRREFPGDYSPQGQWTVEIQPLQENIVGKIRPMLLVLQGALILIVLVVSLNIANLLLARASGRRQEIAVRTALGASRSRILRQMLTESLVLSFLGGGAGIALAVLALKSFLRLLPSTSIPRLGEVTVDWRVLGFALLVSLAAGLLFGLAPALQSAQANLSLAIREGSRGAGYGLKTARLRDVLIVSELAIAVMLMVGAGLLLKTFRELLKEDPGFNPSQVITANVNLPFPGDPKNDPYPTVTKQAALFRELQRRLLAIPGVEQVGFVSHLPASGISFNFQLGIEGRPTDGADQLRARDIIINPDYFRALQTPLLRGRFFTEADEDGKPRVAIVDESTAHRYWPNRDPLGRRLRMGQGEWMTVVGVVKDIRQESLDVTGNPQVYVPMYQKFDVQDGYVFRDLAILLRTTLPASALEPQIRQQVKQLDSSLPVYDVVSMNALLDRSLAARRFSADLVGGFAVVALLLASIGIYGLLAYMVSQRSREIGLRMALGAQQEHVLKMFLNKGVALAAIGIVGGVLLSALCASIMAGVLYGVRPRDPVVFLSVPLLLFVVAVLASYFPARRATQVDPMIALREG